MNLKQRLDLELEEFLDLNQNYSFERMNRSETDPQETPAQDKGQEASGSTTEESNA